MVIWGKILNTITFLFENDDVVDKLKTDSSQNFFYQKNLQQVKDKNQFQFIYQTIDYQITSEKN